LATGMRYFHVFCGTLCPGVGAHSQFRSLKSSYCKKYDGLQSPAERLNGFSYHENWLRNLLISASSGGFRGHP